MPPKHRNLRVITRELIGSPFFPILFIGEFVKAWVSTGTPPLNFALMAVVAAVLWIVSDSLDHLWLFAKCELVGLSDPEWQSDE